nr:hypothetical protein CFP56_43602 [Quercus suber]
MDGYWAAYNSGLLLPSLFLLLFLNSVHCIYLFSSYSRKRNMVRKKDRFWKHAEDLNGRFKCKFCEREFAGGATRIKRHLAGVKGHDIDICTKVSKEDVTLSRVSEKSNEEYGTEIVLSVAVEGLLAKIDDIEFKFEVHYGGTFLWNPNLEYFGGKVEIVYDKDPDKLSYFEIEVELPEGVGGGVGDREDGDGQLESDGDSVVVEEPHDATTAIKKEFDWFNEGLVGEDFDDDIKTVNLECTCPLTFQNSQVTSTYVANMYLEDFSRNPNWEVSGVQHQVMQQISIDLSLSQVYRSRKAARGLIIGNEEQQYSLLRDYLEMIRMTGVGSKVILQIEMKYENVQPKFKRMYIRFVGQLLSTTTKDGNDNIFLVAMVVVEQENKYSWIWFLGQFADDIGRPEQLNLVFISDRQKSLILAMETLFPTVEHRYTVRGGPWFSLSQQTIHTPAEIWDTKASSSQPTRPPATRGTAFKGRNNVARTQKCNTRGEKGSYGRKGSHRGKGSHCSKGRIGQP